MPKTNGMVGFLVDSHCHVGLSYLDAIRTVVKRLRPPWWSTWRKMPRSMRRQVMRQIVARHRANRRMYDGVNLGTWL